MRSLERNKITIFYALYSSKIPVLDEFGNETGNYTSGFGNPVKLKINVAPNQGESSSNPFGTFSDYDRVLSTTDRLPIDEMSIVWTDVVPVLELDGSTLTPHDFKVTKVAPYINQHRYAIKKLPQNT